MLYYYLLRRIDKLLEIREWAKRMGKTAFQKIIDSHLKTTLSDGRLVLSLDRVWCHEITTPNAILDARSRNCDVVFNPNKIKTMIDHVNPAKDTTSAMQGKILREWSKEHNIEFLDVGRNGVCHAVIPEMGWVAPGDIGIMGDSHTCTHGAFCAFVAGVGTTDLEGGIITGLWICPPQKVIRVNFTGELPSNVFAKDLILALIAKIGVNGATNAILEFGGSVIKNMSMESRMTITNMSVEAGATSGMMMVDQITVDYLWPVYEKDYVSRKEALKSLSKWNSDFDCKYEKIITIDVSELQPLSTQNYSPGDSVLVCKLKGKKINQVYIGSCTNGRIEDLRIAAEIFTKEGKNVADEVRCIIVPATQNIYMQAMKEGLLDIFAKAGCYISGPTCGACLGMSCGVLAPNEVCVSTTNRNFPGRMGKDGMVHLVSPATAAITAINGFITSPSRDLCSSILSKLKEKECMKAHFSPRADKLIFAPDYGALIKLQDKSKKEFSGQAFCLEKDNVDTDQIIPAKYLTETNKEKFGEYCLEDVKIKTEDRARLRQSQILIAGKNFGCGSSREHAVWALETAGIQCVIAPSFARIFYNNMFNNGLLCVELPEEQIRNLFKNKPLNIEINIEKKYVKWDNQQINFPLSEHQKELIQSNGSIGVMLKLASDLLA